MAPKRRTQSARTAPSAQQSKLSFHGKQSKVTKPATAQNAKDSKKDPALVEDVVNTDLKAETDVDLSEPTTAELAIKPHTEHEGATLDTIPDPLEANGGVIKAENVLGGRAELSDVGAIGGKASGWVADEEEQAKKVTDTRIKQYWRKKEEARLAPRVHQEDLTVYEKVLREWDMSGQYGVSSASLQEVLGTWYGGLTKTTAVHRHSTPQAMEASKSAWPATADRSPRCASQGDGYG